MEPARLARSSLRADAAYCAATGAAAVAAARPIGRAVGAPPGGVRAAGGATMVWAAVVALLAGATSWRGVTGVVGLANAVAAAGLALGGVTRRRRSGRRLLFAVAAEVASFAVAQFAALRRGRRGAAQAPNGSRR